MKEKREKISLIIAAVAILLLLIFLVVIQMLQNKSQTDLVDQIQGGTQSVEHADDAVKATGVVINEVSGDGWIELYNQEASDIDISGFYVCINGEKILIGNGSLLQANDYFIVSLTGKINVPGNNYIELYTRRDEVLDICFVDSLTENVSYARTIDGGDSYLYMKQSKKSSNEAVEAVTAGKPQFDKPSGFYTNDIVVNINAKPGQKIYYTLDGSIPTKDSNLYSEPIKISDRSGEENIWSAKEKISMNSWYVPNDHVDKCTILSAIAVDDAGNISDICRASYYVEIGNKKAYDSLPVVSIITDPDKLFDYFDGMYMLGRTYEDMIAQEKNEAIYANYMQDWNAEASVQFFNEQHYNSKNLEATINIYKDKAVDNSQKSIEISSDNGHYILSNGDVDSSMKIRQGLATALLEDTNISIPSEACLVFIDGEFWGMYEMITRFDSEYVSSKTGISKDHLVTAVNGVVDKASYQNDYNDLYEFVTGQNMRMAENYQKLCKMMDVESYAYFVCSNIFFANASEKIPQYMWKETTSEGKWQWAIGDMRSTLGCSSLSTESIDTFLRPAIRDNVFFNRLMQNKEFQKVFRASMDKLKSEYLSDENVENVINNYTEKYIKAVSETSVRFSGAYAEDAYKSSMEYIKEFLINRAEFVDIYTNEYIDKAGSLKTEIEDSEVGGSRDNDDRDNS